VEFVVPGRAGSLTLVECKSGRTVTPAMASPLRRLAEAVRKRRPRSAKPRAFLVHQAPSADTQTRAVAPGVQAVAWQDFVAEL
jgi:hypothetical protein